MSEKRPGVTVAEAVLSGLNHRLERGDLAAIGGENLQPVGVAVAFKLAGLNPDQNRPDLRAEIAVALPLDANPISVRDTELDAVDLLRRARTLVETIKSVGAEIGHGENSHALAIVGLSGDGCLGIENAQCIVVHVPGIVEGGLNVDAPRRLHAVDAEALVANKRESFERIVVLERVFTDATSTLTMIPRSEAVVRAGSAEGR